MMWFRSFAAAALVVVACVPFPAIARRAADPAATGLPAIRLARRPPDFAFAGTTADPGAPARLSALVGRPVVVNFWASWCEPCRSEIGAFVQLERTYGADVPLVAVSEDQTPGAAEAYLRDHGVSAINVDDPDRKIFALYTVVPIPTTLVLAPDGSVAHVSVGALDWDELRVAVDRVRASGLTLPPAFGTVNRNAGTPEP